MIKEKSKVSKKAVTSLTVLFVLVGLIASSTVAAAPSAKANFEVSFGFKAADKVHPGGHYEILFEEGDSHFSLRNVKTGKVTIVPFATRTEGRGQCKSCGKPIGEAELVFQQDEGAPYLYEVYMPNSDGFHLGAAPGKEHKHVGVRSGH
jgi:hypothetical protein